MEGFFILEVVGKQPTTQVLSPMWPLVGCKLSNLAKSHFFYVHRGSGGGAAQSSLVQNSSKRVPWASCPLGRPKSQEEPAP